MWRKAALAAMCCVALTGCQTDRIGGLLEFSLNVGDLADFYAGTNVVAAYGGVDGRTLRVFHAYTSQAALGYIARDLPASAAERAAIAKRIGDSTVKLNDLLGCLFPSETVSVNFPKPPLSPNPSVKNPNLWQMYTFSRETPCFQYNMLMRDYIISLGDTAREISRFEQIKAFEKNLLNVFSSGATAAALASSVGGGAGLAGGLASAAAQQLLADGLKILYDAWKAGGDLGALYNDMILLQASVYLRSNNGKPAEFESAYKAGNINALREYFRNNDKRFKFRLADFAQITKFVEAACGNLTAEPSGKMQCKAPPTLIEPCFKQWVDNRADNDKEILKKSAEKVGKSANEAAQIIVPAKMDIPLMQPSCAVEKIDVS